MQHLLLLVGPEHDEGAVEGAGRGRQLPHSPHQHHQQAEDQPWTDGRIRKWVIWVRISQYQKADAKTRNQAAGESSARLSAAVLWIKLSSNDKMMRRIFFFANLRVWSVLDMKRAREM